MRKNLIINEFEVLGSNIKDNTQKHVFYPNVFYFKHAMQLKIKLHPK